MENDNKVKVVTQFDRGTIMQWEEYGNAEHTDLILSIQKRVIKLQDEGIRNALIALGWTPPKGDSNESL